MNEDENVEEDEDVEGSGMSGEIQEAIMPQGNMKEFNKKSLIEAQNVRKRLKKYVHKSGCLTWIECPLDCCKEIEELDLETSIAWEASDDISAAIAILTDSFHDTKRKEKKIENCCISLETVHAIIARHSHKHEEVYKMVDDAFGIVHIMWKRLKRELQRENEEKAEKTP